MIPEGYVFTVELNDNVRAAQTIIARKMEKTRKKSEKSGNRNGTKHIKAYQAG